MTTYLGDKAVGIGTVKAEIGVTGNVLHDDTLVGNGNTEPLGVNTANIVSQQTLANTVSVLNNSIDAQADAIAKTRENSVKKSGDTMTGILTIQAEEDYDPSTPPVGGLSFKSNASPDEFTNRMRQVANGFVAIEYLLNGKQYSNLVFGDQEIYIDNTENGTGNPVSLGTSGNPWDNVYAKKLNNGADVAIPTEGGTLARIEDLSDIRADMNAEDSRLQTQITSQASQITTNKNDIDELGDDVAEIQAKIPESASGNNPLITKQQLLDEEMDIRADYNELVSELQTQITAQAGAIAKLDSEKIDKNQGTINAGKYLMVGDDGIVGLTDSGGGGGIANVIHDSTLTGKGTDDEPLGVAKNLEVEELTVGTDEGTLNLSITAGVATLATNNGLDIVSPTKFDKAPTTDDNTTYANALDVSLMRKAQVATAISDALDNVDALPDQTDNAGKFLTTDGTEASWSDKPLVNNAEQNTQNIAIYGTATGNTVGLISIGYGSTATSLYNLTDVIALGRNATAKNGESIAIGGNSRALTNRTVAIGRSAQASAEHSLALGTYATASATYCTQLGNGTNSDSNTFKVANSNGNFEMMSADGTIPADRMSTTAGTTGQVLTKTDTGMGWSDVSSTRIIFREWE